MGKLTNVVIEKIKKFLKKAEEPILDKKGRPMTKEQVEEAWGMLKSYFYLDFRDDAHGKNLRDSDEMDDYRPDAERLHKLKEFLLLEYETLDLWIKNSKKHSKVYPLEHILTEKEKKHLSAKYVKRNDKMIVDHLALQRRNRKELKKKMQAIKEELMLMGVMLPEWKKEKSKKKSKFTLQLKRKKQEQSKGANQNNTEILK